MFQLLIKLRIYLENINEKIQFRDEFNISFVKRNDSLR